MTLTSATNSTTTNTADPHTTISQLPLPASAATAAAVNNNEDWEEWDGTSPFWHHCLAGSIAGVAEHGLVYPLDTVRTHLQVCAHCPNHNQPTTPSTTTFTNVGVSSVKTPSPNTAALSWRSSTTSATTAASVHHHPQGMWRTMRHLMSLPAAAAANSKPTATSILSDAVAPSLQPPLQQQYRVAGIARLWRGAQTIILGCIPAHALYFSSFEAVKYSFTSSTTHGGILPWYGSMLAGATATISHDLILTPLDTIKQRLQLGHYHGMAHAMRHMIQYEGWTSLYRSFSITLLTNIPYGMIMVTTNESCKAMFLQQQQQQQHGSSPPTTTLTWTATIVSSSLAGMMASFFTTPLDRIKTYLQVQQLQPACQEGSCPLIGSSAHAHNSIASSWPQALQRLLQQPQGVRGLWHGALPRVLSHTPSVAISWTTYEAAKQYLAAHYME